MQFCEDELLGSEIGCRDHVELPLEPDLERGGEVIHENIARFPGYFLHGFR